ncbi:hypothetical protein [Tateyamaria sp.]|uniref:hypothetical protein n=1 Tax=Tateyamaria sp. TaxID=1929288 RepID=UPI003B212247
MARYTHAPLTPSDTPLFSRRTGGKNNDMCDPRKPIHTPDAATTDDAYDMILPHLNECVENAARETGLAGASVVLILIEILLTVLSQLDPKATPQFLGALSVLYDPAANQSQNARAEGKRRAAVKKLFRAVDLKRPEFEGSRLTRSTPAPLTTTEVIMTPEQVIARLAEGAAQMASNAEIGGCEIAGMFVSVLHANPELIPAFLDSPVATCVDGGRFSWEYGSLSWCSKSGRTVTPAELRRHLDIQDN